MAEFKLKFKEERPYVFVSYKSDDKEIVENSIQYLQEHYGLNIWYDADLTAGYNWDDEALPKLIDENCQLVLLFASEEALCSPNVKKELDEAKYYEKLIVPINFSNRSFDDIMRYEITRKYSKTNMPKVQNARKLIKEHLNEQRTYIFLHKSDYYEELIRSIKRITEKYDQNVFIYEPVIDYFSKQKTINNREVSVAVTLKEEIAPALEKDNFIKNDKKTDNLLENVEINNIPKKIQKKVVTNKKEDHIAPKKHAIKEKNDFITYRLYGQEYSGKQSDLMFNVFDKVIENHPDKLDEIADSLYSVSLVDYEKKENIDGNMKSYFRLCKTFSTGGKKYCVGVSLGINDKLYQIAKLLSVCGENFSILEIDGQELPNIKSSSLKKVTKQREIISTKGSLIDFTLYDSDYKGNQSDMMLLIFEKIIATHPDKIKLLHEKLTSVSLIDKNENIIKGNSSTFNTNKIINVNGDKISVGTNFGIIAKLSQLAKLLNICGEEQSVLQIEGYKLPQVNVR